MKQKPEVSLPFLQSLGGIASEDIEGITAILSHDLKSPISIIISTLEVLIALNEETGDDDEGTIRLLKGALSAAHRQMFLISDILDLIKLKTDSYEFDYQIVHVSEAVENCLEANAEMLAAKKLRVEHDLSREPDLTARIDLHLLNRMIGALIDGVLKFTTHGDTLRIQVKRSGDNIVIRFIDSGRPITPGFEQRLFEYPPRWEDRQAGTRTSVALGLPFAYAAACAQGGDMTAKSDPTTNLTTFTISLPRVHA